jgi:hypothetical protein
VLGIRFYEFDEKYFELLDKKLFLLLNFFDLFFRESSSGMEREGGA